MIRKVDRSGQTGVAEAPAVGAVDGDGPVGDVSTQSVGADGTHLNRMQRRRASRGLDPAPKPQKWFHPHKK